MVFLTVTLKPLWKKEALKLTIPRSIDGLSITHLPWLWRLKKLNAPLLRPGEWMKLISKLRVNEFTCIAPLINLAIRLILCFPSTVISQRPAPSLNKHDTNGFPNKVAMDKSGADYAGLESINMWRIQL